jgi:Spy/CpxP family protein refolding chaperone
MKATQLFTALALAALLAAPAASQAPPPPPPTQGAPGAPGAGQNRQNEMLFRGITLTPEQRAKVDSIQAAGREAMRAQMQAGGGMQDSTTRAKMQQMRQAQYAEIRKVLTPEQAAIFDENVKNLPPMGEGRRPPPGRAR